MWNSKVTRYDGCDDSRYKSSAPPITELSSECVSDHLCLSFLQYSYTARIVHSARVPSKDK